MSREGHKLDAETVARVNRAARVFDREAEYVAANGLKRCSSRNSSMQCERQSGHTGLHCNGGLWWLASPEART